MVTQWSGKDFSVMARMVNPGKEAYCRKYGYKFVPYEGTLDESRHPGWSKIPAIRDALPRFDWVLWCDVDTVLWNDSVGLRRFITEHCDRNLILQSNYQGPNAGVMLIRNDPWSFALLERIYARTDLLHHPWHDQQALVDLLREPQWRDRCHVYEQNQPYRGFHGYFYFKDYDKLLLHFAGMSGKRRLRLIEQLARLAAYPAHLRLWKREGLGFLLNQLGLLGEGAEVGVANGDFSAKLLSTWEGRRLHMVDAWRHLPGVRDSANVSDEQHETRLQTARVKARTHQGRYQIHRSISVEAARKFAAESLDFVYVDAAYDYESVSADLAAWYPIVRPGGIVAGHGFLDGELKEGSFGVRRAVSEWEQAQGVKAAVTLEEHRPSWYILKPVEGQPPAWK